MNALDILGSLLKGGMGPSAGRLERTVGNKGFGAPGGVFGGGPGGMPGGSQGGGAGSILDMLGKLAGSMQDGGSPGGIGRSSSGGFSTGDLLGSIGKVILGGSGGTGNSSMGAGANSIFGRMVQIFERTV